MDPAQEESEVQALVELRARFFKPGELLPPGAREALNRRSLEEHQAAAERALRRS